jgi:hypothetical protein
MKENKVSKSVVNLGSFIGKNKIPLLYVGGAIALFYIAFPLLKKIKSSFDIKKEVEAGRGGTISDFTYLIKEGNSNISKAQAKIYAEQLFDAFNQSTGTDEASIKEVFRKITPEDFKLVFNEFKRRSYSDFNQGAPSGMILLPDSYLGYTNLDLLGWLKKELGIFDFITKSTVNKVINPLGFNI